MRWFRHLSVTLSEQVIRLVIQFVTVLTVSRLVELSDFGISALATLALNFVATLGQVAIEPLIIRSKYIRSDVVNSLWILGLIVNSAILVLVLITGLLGLIPRESFGIALAISVGIFSWSIGSVSRALLTRWQQYPKLLIVGVCGSLTNLLVSVSLALAQQGALALVIGQASAVACSSLVAIFLCMWKPTIGRISNLDLSQLRFLKNSLLFGLTTFSARNLDTILIFASLGAAALGIYDRAYMLIITAFQILSLSVGRVLLPQLSVRVKQNLSITQTYYQGSSLMAFLAMVILEPMLIESRSVTQLLYGDGYSAVATILPILAVAAIFQALANSSGALYIATDQTKKLLKIGVVTSSIYAASFLYAYFAANVQTFAEVTIFAAAISLIVVNRRIGQDFGIKSVVLIRLYASLALVVLCSVASHIALKNYFDIESGATAIGLLMFNELFFVFVCLISWKKLNKGELSIFPKVKKED